eukprot:4107349-Karenia_brevis.AAC.1
MLHGVADPALRHHILPNGWAVPPAWPPSLQKHPGPPAERTQFEAPDHVPQPCLPDQWGTLPAAGTGGRSPPTRNDARAERSLYFL